MTAPITDTWSVVGRLGIQRSRTDANSSAITVGGRALGIQSSDSAVSAKFGLGVQYDFTPRIGLRGEWERYRVPDSIGGKMDWDLYSVGGIFRF